MSIAAEKFFVQLKSHYKSLKGNTPMLVKEAYDRILMSVKAGERNRTNNRYIVQQLSENDFRLLKKGSNKIVVPIEEYYECIKGIHEELGHAGRNITSKNVASRYCIGQREVMIFIDNCVQCQMKGRKMEKHSVSKFWWR